MSISTFYLIAASMLSLAVLPIAQAQGLSQAQTSAQTHICDTENTAVLSEDSLNAYLESLRFCLVQIGEVSVYTPELELQLRRNIRQNFRYFPQDVQANLINARQIWQQYQNQWAFLDLAQKKEFGFAVLGLAFGEQAAADALGMAGKSSAGSSGVDVDSIGGGCYGGHCETVGDTVEVDSN